MKTAQFIQFTFISLFLLIGVSTTNAKELAETTQFYDLAQGNQTMKGPGEMDVAGKLYMSLSLNNNRVSGKYYYNRINKGKSKKQWISVSGTVNWDEFTMKLKEKNGTFIGRFERIQCGFLYYGIFVRNDGKKFDFSIELY